MSDEEKLAEALDLLEQALFGREGDCVCEGAGTCWVCRANALVEEDG